MDTSGIMYATDAPQLNSGFWALASVVVAVCCGADQSEARDLRLLHHREVPREEWYQEALLTDLRTMSCSRDVRVIAKRRPSEFSGWKLLFGYCKRRLWHPIKRNCGIDMCPETVAVG